MSTFIVIHMLATVLVFCITALVYLSQRSARFRDACRQITGKAKEAADDLNEEDRFDPVVFIRWLLIPLFFSLVVFFIPLAYMDTDNNNLFTSVFDAIIRSGQTFSLDSSIQDVWAAADTVDLVLTPLDRAWIAFFLALAPILTAVTAATLFRIPKFWFAMRFSRRKICIFSDLNERAKMYAEALLRGPADHRDGRKPYIVFCSDGKLDNVDTSNLAGQHLVLRQEICDIYLLPRARKRARFYVISNDDNTTIEIAGKLQRKYGQDSCRIYCVSSGTLNEHAIDGMNRAVPKPGDGESGKTGSEENKNGSDIRFEDGQIADTSDAAAEKIRHSYIEIVSEPSRVVYHTLYNRSDPLVDRAFLTDVLRINEAGDKPKIVQVLVLGVGLVGEELVRTLLWYFQLPDIGVRITVADKETERTLRARIFRKNPEFEYLLQRVTDTRSPSDNMAARASVRVLGEKDLLSDDLENILRDPQCGDGYHFVFIATGDDNQNYRLALRVRKHCLRYPNPWGCPKVRAVIWNQTLNNIIGKPDFTPLQGTAGAENIRKDDYAFRFPEQKERPIYNPLCPVGLIGSMSETVMPLNDLVYDALRYHSYYCNSWSEDLIQNTVRIPADHYRTFYSSSESDERSNWAAAVHGFLKYQWFTAETKTAADEDIRHEAFTKGRSMNSTTDADVSEAYLTIEAAKLSYFTDVGGPDEKSFADLAEAAKKLKKCSLSSADLPQAEDIRKCLETFRGYERSASRILKEKDRTPETADPGRAAAEQDTEDQAAPDRRERQDMPCPEIRGSRDAGMEKDPLINIENPKNNKTIRELARLHDIFTLEDLIELRKTARLSEAEQTRWCIFKLLEGDAPVPEEALEKYMAHSAKGRDMDPIRGYHSAIRSWRDLIGKKDDDIFGKDKRWAEFVKSTDGVARFSIKLEKCRAEHVEKAGKAQQDP